MGKVKKQLKESVLSVLVETSKGAMRVMVRDVENVSEGFLKEMISNSRHEDKEDYKSENFRERTLAVPRGLRDCVFSLVHCKLLKYGPKSPFTIMTKSIGGMCDYYNLDLVKIFMAKIDYHTHTHTHITHSLGFGIFLIPISWSFGGEIVFFFWCMLHPTGQQGRPGLN
jgi:hypothetical protein